jgi:hypothetical protein
MTLLTFEYTHFLIAAYYATEWPGGGHSTKSSDHVAKPFKGHETWTTYFANTSTRDDH